MLLRLEVHTELVECLDLLDLVPLDRLEASRENHARLQKLAVSDQRLQAFGDLVQILACAPSSAEAIPERRDGDPHRIQKPQRIPDDPLFIPQAGHLPPLSDAAIQPGRPARQPLPAGPQAALGLANRALNLCQRPHELGMQRQAISVGRIVCAYARREGGGEGCVDVEKGREARGVGRGVQEGEGEGCWCELVKGAVSERFGQGGRGTYVWREHFRPVSFDPPQDRYARSANHLCEHHTQDSQSISSPSPAAIPTSSAPDLFPLPLDAPPARRNASTTATFLSRSTSSRRARARSAGS